MSPSELGGGQAGWALRSWQDPQHKDSPLRQGAERPPGQEESGGSLGGGGPGAAKGQKVPGGAAGAEKEAPSVEGVRARARPLRAGEEAGTPYVGTTTAFVFRVQTKDVLGPGSTSLFLCLFSV